MKKFGGLVLFAFLFACTHNSVKLERQPQSEASQSPLFLEKVKIGDIAHAQRMGFLLESADAPFKGCVLYMQGLGDSIMNHYPLFNKLTGAGYRVLMFDYLGQGGSEGSMSTMRVWAEGDPFPRNSNYEIGNQARFVWERYSKIADPVHDRTCEGSPRRVIGWSTGGLAAYKLAWEKWADAYALIAPGIVPQYCVGEAAGDCMSNLSGKSVITKRTLTRNEYKSTYDPHLEPIRPSSIVGEVKEFAINLVTTAKTATEYKIAKDLPGIVFLSSKADTYVDSEATAAVLAKQAPSFQVIRYEGALHELDNEVPEVANDVHARMIQFFDTAK